MWKDPKFIVIAGLLVVLIAAVGTLGGLALTRQNDDDQSRTIKVVLPENTANILENQHLSAAELMDKALDNYLDKLVEEDKITQEEADQFQAWWESRPDIPGIFRFFEQDNFNFFGMMHMNNGGLPFGFGGGK